MYRLMIAAAVLASPAVAQAQANPATVTPFALGTGTYSQNFDTLASTGTTGIALPTGWQVIETGGNTSYGVSNGTANGGGSYSFGANGNAERALGSLASNAVTQVLFGGVLTNATGSTITDLAFAYTGEQWRVANAASDSLVFQYQIGATGLGTGSWTTVAGLAFAPLFANGTGQGAMLNGNLPVNQRAIGSTIGLSLAAGQNFGFRWVDSNAANTDQGLAIDNLSITATLAAVAPVPEPASWAMMIAGVGLVGAATRRRTGTRVRFA